MIATDSDDAEAVVESMQDAIENAACLSLTYSVRDSSVNGMDIRKGDQIGFLGKDLRACAATVEECIKQLLLQVEDLEDKEIVTVMYGNDTTDEDRECLRLLVEEFCPDAELIEYDCEQELYRLLITLE